MSPNACAPTMRSKGPSSRSFVNVILLGATLVLGSCTTVTPGASQPADPGGPASPLPTASLEAPRPSLGASPSATAPSSSEPAGVAAVQLPLGLAAITVTSGLNLRSRPVVRDDTLVAVLANGARLRIVEGPIFDAGYWWYRVSTSIRGHAGEGWVASADLDGSPWIGPARDACLDFDLPVAAISIETLAQLQVGFRGTWAGCVTTPWVPPYWVTLTFREDGTYSGVAQIGPTGERQPAFYHGSDADSATKRYALNDLQDSRLGVGQIDIFHSADSVSRGDLRTIRLMGDRLSFEFFHRGIYGPIAFQLYRINAPD